MPEPLALPAETLRAFAVDVLRALGAPAEPAAAVATSLVESDLRGHVSHGVRRLAPYADLVRTGDVDPAATPVVVEGTPAAAVVVDGRDAFGQLTARLGADELIRRAGGAGGTAVAVAALRRCRHVGRLGEYVEQLAAAGLVGFALANADPWVAPWGGRARLFGTNPLAWGAPTSPGAPPLVVDFATSATAEGKVAVARTRGETLPEGQVVDADGNPSTDPEALYAGGALLPMGAHKGYGLALVADLVAGMLSGTGSVTAAGYDGTFGTLLVAIDVAPFCDPDAFRREVEDLRDRVHATPTAVGFDAVQVPGEPEWTTRAERLAGGVPVAAGARDELDALATRLGVTPLSDR